jgi:large subunit ribosomal protein L35
MAKVKMKTKRGAAKRFKATGNGLKHKHDFKSHILTKMSTKRKRQLRGTSELHPADVQKVERMLRLR